MADTNQRPRGGMTLDAISFRQGVFPPWPEKFRDVSPTGWCHRIGGHWDRCGVYYVEPIDGAYLR